MSFAISPVCLTPPCQEKLLCSCIITQSSTEQFISRFCCEFETKGNDVAELLICSFSDYCFSILDVVAPLKIKSKSIRSLLPWMIERVWKSTGLEVHCLYLKDLIYNFNVLVQESRNVYFSNLIALSKRNPKVLFSTINNIVSTPVSEATTFSLNDCNRFLLFFVNKLNTIHSNIISSPHLHGSSLIPNRPVLIDYFQPIDFQGLLSITRKMKITLALRI